MKVEITIADDKTEDIYTPGRWFISTTEGPVFIVQVSGDAFDENTKSSFSAQVICSKRTSINEGDFSKRWEKKWFKPFYGEIKLISE